MQLSYTKIFKTAFSLIWKNSFLWVFGFFVSFIGSLGTYKMVFQKFNKLTTDKIDHVVNAPDKWELFYTIKASFLSSLTDFNALSLLFTILMLLLVVAGSLIFLWMIFTSQGALINCVKKLSKREKTNFNDGVKVGNKNFVPVFFINLLAKIAVFISILLITLALTPLLIAKISLGLNYVLFLISFILLIAISLIISFIAIYSVCFKVINNFGILKSIKAAWNLFLKNWLISIEMALLLFLINILAGFVGFLALTLLLTPFVLLSLVFFYFGVKIAFVSIIVIASVLATVLVIIFTSVLSAFILASWTLLFMQINKKKVSSKIIETAKKWL